MKKYHCYSANFDIYTEKLFREAVFLGQGNNGVVYRLPQNMVIKLFAEKKVYMDEVCTFRRTNGSKFFPRVKSYGSLYILRDMVEGIRLDKYIKKYGLSDKLVKNIYNMLKEFKRLKFLKIDCRCKDVYVGTNMKLMMIDPKKCYRKKRNFPRHLLKGLGKLEILEDFFKYLEKIDIKKSREWQKSFFGEDL